MAADVRLKQRRAAKHLFEELYHLGSRFCSLDESKFATCLMLGHEIWLRFVATRRLN